ncbi:MAG TPA: M3 family metallopeptidase, partial [Bacillota bacterium]|nr:M3 family metallopeptidase [Bacillota bacterium]
MKFSEMKYERPNFDEIKEHLNDCILRFNSAESYKEARKIFDEAEKLSSRIGTLGKLVSIRHSIDTRDEFYDEENKVWNRMGPELAAYGQQWMLSMLESPFKKDFIEEFGDLMFVNAEIALRTFRPEIIPQLQEENQLADDYETLLASAQIEFEGSTYTLSQLTPFKNDPDDARRLAAWQAEGRWYKENQPGLDELYDKLVHLRHEIAKELGHENYIPLGYDRMSRNCYTKADVEKFRAAVVKYLVPVAAEIYKEKARRLGKEYPMNFADNALSFRSGNPRPCGSADDILAHGKKFYEELSPETGEFLACILTGTNVL